MEIMNTGCALCNSTWGNYYETIENKKYFFCCDVCANIFKEIVTNLKILYKINIIESLYLQGTSRSRTYQVESINKHYRGQIIFNNGRILEIIDQSEKT